MKAEAREFLTAGLRPVDCDTCGTCVLVKKNSAQHTSVQWTTDAASSCSVFAERKTAGENTALLDSCERLSDSIVRAVENGLVEVAGD